MKLPVQLTTALGKLAVKAAEHAPKIMFGAGIVGSVTSTVMACKATLKLPEILEETEAALDAARTPNPTEDDHRRVYRIYARATGQILRLYAPSAVVGVVSVGLLTGSHTILSRRNAQLTAAYSGLKRAYDEYRDRVREELGEDRERELYLGLRTEDGVDENGKKVKELVTDGSAPYTYLFDASTSSAWERNRDTNFMFLQAQQAHFNTLLAARGHVFLNEVLDRLGLEHTKEGAVVGWIKESETGDQYVDFGIHTAKNANMVAGPEQSVWLNFNVDGLIYDQLG